mgnify:CR=1 FL=1
MAFPPRIRMPIACENALFQFDLDRAQRPIRLASIRSLRWQVVVWNLYFGNESVAKKTVDHILSYMRSSPTWAYHGGSRSWGDVRGQSPPGALHSPRAPPAPLQVPESVEAQVKQCTIRYGKVKLVRVSLAIPFDVSHSMLFPSVTLPCVTRHFSYISPAFLCFCRLIRQPTLWVSPPLPQRTVRPRRPPPLRLALRPATGESYAASNLACFF